MSREIYYETKIEHKPGCKNKTRFLLIESRFGLIKMYLCPECLKIAYQAWWMKVISEIVQKINKKGFRFKKTKELRKI